MHSRPDQATIHDTDKIHAEQYSIFPAGHPCAARTRAEHQYRQGSLDIRLCSKSGFSAFAYSSCLGAAHTLISWVSTLALELCMRLQNV